MAQKHRQAHNHTQSSQHHDVSEDAQAWSEGENDSTPKLPSNASWASTKEDKERKVSGQKSRTSSVTSIDYPTIEASVKVSATGHLGGPVSSRERKDSGRISDQSSTLATKPIFVEAGRKSSFDKGTISSYSNYIILNGKFFSLRVDITKI